MISLTSLFLFAGLTYFFYVVGTAVSRVSNAQREGARQRVEQERLNRQSKLYQDAEAKRDARRREAIQKLSERPGDFEIYCRQSEARPGWAASLTPEQIENFGIEDNFEPIQPHEVRY